MNIVEALAELYSNMPICLHEDPRVAEIPCLSAIRAGFISGTVDRTLEADARTPANVADNVDITALGARITHSVGCLDPWGTHILGASRASRLLSPLIGSRPAQISKQPSARRPTGWESPFRAGLSSVETSV